VSINARATFGAEGQLLYCDCFIQDINERRRAEEALKETEEWHQNILQTAMDGFLLLSADGRLLDLNDAYCRMSGYRVNELLALKISHLDIKQMSAESAAYISAIKERGEERFESSHRRKDGTVFDVEVAVQYWPINGGRFVCFLKDITERKRAERALRDREQLLRVSQKIAGLGTYVLDVRTGIWKSSAILDEIFGINEEFERSVDGWLSLVHPESRSKMSDYFSQTVLIEGHRFDKEYRIIRRCDGRIRWVHGLGALTVDTDDRSVKFAGTILDITARKSAEEEKGKLEIQLRHAQKMESVGRLAGGVAHDFNNLLTVINGYSGFLLNELHPNDPLREYAQEVNIAGERAAGLTKQLLAFSRNQKVEPRALDLNEAIEESAPMLRRLIGEDIALETEYDPSLGKIMADPVQIHQIIMNLAVNARDAMAGGGMILIETQNRDIGEDPLSVHPDAKPGNYAALLVMDNGRGMDEATLERIFEPFFTTKGVGQGTGLGLATVYGIVRQNGGWIDVQSELGIGTSFQIYFPRVGAYLEPLGNKNARLVSSGTETVMIVEDQPAVQAFIGRALHQYGYEVLQAACGDEAIQIVEGHAGNIDLLITDVVMPGMNGKKLCERLRTLRPKLKVLFISGYTADVIAQRGVLEDGLALLHKPFSPETLAIKVAEVLRGASPEAKR